MKEEINSNNNPDIFIHHWNIGPFEIKEKIGEGSFGTVYIGIHRETNKKVAVKIIPKEKKKKRENENVNLKEYVNKIYNEINIHKKLFHPYICKMYYAIETFSDIIIVTEYCSGGEVFNILYNSEEAFEEARACKIFSQILSSIEYLHNKDIVQRDIKLENFLMDEFNDTKLTDFGLSVICEKDKYLHDIVCSLYYAAPEIFSSSVVNYDGKKADIWSLGICLYYMVCGDNPFNGEDREKFIDNLIHKDLEVPEGVSPLFQDFIYRILDKNPETRLTIQQIKEHKWLHIIDFNFMKCIGIFFDKDILPIDIDIIKNLSEHNEEKIRNLISDILLNKHNENTIKYYLNVESLERNKKDSVSNMKPTSNLYLKYIKGQKSKLEFYGNDINKKVDELTKIVLNEFKEEEYRIRQEIQNSLCLGKSKTETKKSEKKSNPNTNNNNSENKENNDKNNINNNNNVNNISNKENNADIKNINNADNNKPLNEKNNQKFRHLRSKSFILDKYEDFLKKEEEKEKKKEEIEELLKKNKINVLNQYISPLLFVHDLVDEIISKVIQLKATKEAKRRIIPVNFSSINIFGKKKPLNAFETIKEENNNTSQNETNKKNKNLNFSVEKLCTFSFSPKKNKAKTSSDFYPKNKISKNTKFQNKGQAENKIKIKKDHLERENKYKQLKYNNNDNKINKPINEQKNNNKKFKKKKISNHHSKNQSKNNNINSSIFPKNKRELKKKTISEKTEDNKRSSSLKQKEKKISILNVEEFNINIKEKQKSTPKKKISEILKELFEKYDQKQDIKEKRDKKDDKKKSDKKEDKKEKKEKKNILKNAKTIDENNKRLISRKFDKNSNYSNNIDENLNINEEKERKRKLTIAEEQNSKYKKNFNMSQDNFYRNSTKLMNTTISNINSAKKLDKEKKISVDENLKNGKNKNAKNSKKSSHNYSKSITFNDESKLNKTSRQTHQKMPTTPINISGKMKKKDIKNSILNNKSKHTIFNLSGRNKRSNTLLDKNFSTNDSSDKNQFDLKDNKNNQIKTLKSDYSYSCRNIFGKNGFKANINNNKNIIETKKDEKLIKDIIIDNIGYNNITVSNFKESIKFICKMFIEKKSAEFILKLDLTQKEKKIYIITGKFTEGDNNIYEKLFSTIKEKLE